MQFPFSQHKRDLATCRVAKWTSISVEAVGFTDVSMYSEQTLMSAVEQLDGEVVLGELRGVKTRLRRWSAGSRET